MKMLSFKHFSTLVRENKLQPNLRFNGLGATVALYQPKEKAEEGSGDIILDACKKNRKVSKQTCRLLC